MKSQINIIIFLIGTVICSCTEPFNQKYFNHIYEDGHVWIGEDAIQTKSGGYALIGETTAFNGEDLLFTTMDSYGNVLKTLIIKGDSIDLGMGLLETNDGGFLLTGQSNSIGHDLYDILLVKLSSELELEWSKLLGGYNFDYGNDMVQNKDDTYLLTGYSYSYGAGEDDMFVIKFSETGDTLWTKLYGGKLNEHSKSIVLTDDGGAAIAGHTANFSNGFYDAYVIRINAEGDTLWTRTYGADYHDRAHSILATSDGGFILAGGSEKTTNDMDMCIFKLNKNGDLLWCKTYGTDKSDLLNSISKAASGGYYACGFSKGFDGSSDQVILRLDESGDTLWTLVLGNEFENIASECFETADKAIAVVGKSKEELEEPFKMNFMKLNPDGTTAYCRERKIPFTKYLPNFHCNYTATLISRGLAVKQHDFIYSEVSLSGYQLCIE